MKNCLFCNGNTFVINNQTRDLGVKVLKCTDCDLVFLENFDHIHDDYYEDSNMSNDEVDGISKDTLSLETYNKFLEENKDDSIRRKNYVSEYIKDKTYLDFGCGGGGALLEILDDSNITPRKLYGVELDGIKKFINPKIKVLDDISYLEEKVDVISLFHVLEHIKKPVEFLEEIKKYLTDDGIIIIEVPNIDDVLIKQYKIEEFKKFYFWSPHLYYYSKKTLMHVFKESKYNIDKFDFIQRYPLSNHIGWLLNGKPNGQNLLKCKLVDDDDYSKLLSNKGQTDTLIAIISIKNTDF